MNYGNIKYCDIANGEGVRTSLFVSGCRHHCENCFNPETWSFSYGSEFTGDEVEAILKSLAPDHVNGLTVLGGEPLEPENRECVLDLLRRVKAEFPGKDIWLYTGFVYEGLIAQGDPKLDEILSLVDVLVDGPYVDAQRDITLRFKGSANQRIIDTRASSVAGRAVIWEDDPLFATHSMP